MKSFSEFCTEFFSNNDCEKLIYQMKTIENNGITRPGDYYAMGCEFIFNGMNTGSDYFGLGELLEEHGYNGISHYFPFLNNWDTFIFYCPTDFRGLLFDFSELYSDDKIICYNGLNGPKNPEKVSEYTIDEFLNEYGLSQLFSVSHWNVNWEKLGVNWNN